MYRRTVLLTAACTFLAGCSGQWNVNYEEAVDPALSKSWHVHNVRVTVPETLTVSDDNTYAPNADIVWHGEVGGDRREQVAAILRDGLTEATSSLSGPRGISVRAQLEHFHAVTPAAVARAPAAVHNIAYVIQIFDDQTGEAITPPERIEADLEAFVGSAAITAAIQGQSQRVRIVDHIASVTRGWLGTGPDQRRTFQSIGR
ncbi:MAG: DUF6778 family protein [Pseudomonadota bacterium]